MEKHDSLTNEIKNTTDFFNEITGLFVDFNFATGIVTLYGNNKEIVGIDRFIVKLTKEQCKELICNNIFSDMDEVRDKYYINGEKLELCIKNKHNKIKWLRIRGTVKYQNDERKSFEGYISEITNLNDEQSVYISNYQDSITGLNLKDHFKSKVSSYLMENMNERCALISLGLDNFKYINDSFGNICGDMFLKIISNELKALLKEEDFLCRLQGDEFLIFIPKIESLNSCADKIKEINEIFNKSYEILGKHIYVTTSIGIAMYPDDGQNFEVLFRNSDAAMSIAKTNGKNQYQFFQDKISSELDRKYTIEKELVNALAKNEMFVVFQPKVRLDKDQVGGFEALIRWNNQELGSVPPAEFIPIAEECGIINSIGKFVLEEVFLKVKYLIDEGYDNFKIAFNLSEVQLREGSIINYFKDLLKVYGPLGQYVEIEITESMLMKSVDRNIRALMHLKSMGASIALDDFGTGYSSFNHLTKLPIDVLKIDKSFVNDIVKNDKSRCVVENIVQLSHKLGIEVVAEGVEEKKQVDYLKVILCDTVQGYYYSKPERFEKAMKLLAK